MGSLLSSMFGSGCPTHDQWTNSSNWMPLNNLQNEIFQIPVYSRWELSECTKISKSQIAIASTTKLFIYNIPKNSWTTIKFNKSIERNPAITTLKNGEILILGNNNILRTVNICESEITATESYIQFNDNRNIGKQILAFIDSDNTQKVHVIGGRGPHGAGRIAHHVVDKTMTVFHKTLDEELDPYDFIFPFSIASIIQNNKLFKFYVSGGRSSGIVEYDGNTWKRVMHLPFGLSGHGSVSCLYRNEPVVITFGGMKDNVGTNDIYVFQINSQTYYKSVKKCPVYYSSENSLNKVILIDFDSTELLVDGYCRQTICVPIVISLLILKFCHMAYVYLINERCYHWRINLDAIFEKQQTTYPSLL